MKNFTAKDMNMAFWVGLAIGNGMMWLGFTVLRDMISMAAHL